MRLLKIATILALASIPLLLLSKDKKKAGVRPVAVDTSEGIDWESLAD